MATGALHLISDADPATDGNAFSFLSTFYEAFISTNEAEAVEYDLSGGWARCILDSIADTITAVQLDLQAGYGDESGVVIVGKLYDKDGNLVATQSANAYIPNAYTAYSLTFSGLTVTAAMQPMQLYLEMQGDYIGYTEWPTVHAVALTATYGVAAANHKGDFFALFR